MDTTELKDLTKIRLEPGDIVMMKFHYTPQPEQREQMMRDLVALFPNNQVMMVPPDVELVILSPPAAAQPAASDKQ